MRLLRRVVNISVLFSALVLTPLLFLTHFNTYLAGLFGDFAGRYLPNSTLLASERKAHREFRNQTVAQAGERARRQAKLRDDMSGRKKSALGKGKRILVRGSATMAVGCPRTSPPTSSIPSSPPRVEIKGRGWGSR